MSVVPSVSPGGWIRIAGTPGLDAVVCTVRADESGDEVGHIEVVYLDDRDRAINSDLRWDGKKWVFVNRQPDGGYADKYPRLQEYVQILRRGRYAS